MVSSRERTCLGFQENGENLREVGSKKGLAVAYGGGALGGVQGTSPQGAGCSYSSRKGGGCRVT